MAAPSLAQAAAIGSSTAGATATATLGSAPTAGNELLFFIDCGAAITAGPVGATQQLAVTGTGGHVHYLYSRDVVGGDGTAWTAHTTAGGTRLDVLEITGQSVASWLNASATQINASSTSVPSASITPTVGNCLILSASQWANQSAWTVGGSFAVVIKSSNAGGSLEVDSLTQGSAAAISETGTIVTAIASTSIIIAVAPLIVSALANIRVQSQAVKRASFY